jgi:hypothetical protein
MLRGDDTSERASDQGEAYGQLFAVISWGCAATTWIARALNSHPDIFCVHALNVALERVSGGPRLDGVDYLRILDPQSFAHPAAGDVHGVSPATLPALREEFGDRFRSVVVVRDPLPRLGSLLSFFDRVGRVEAWDLTHSDSLVEEKAIELPDRDYATRFFVHAANMLNAVVGEVAAGPIYRAEDITSSRAALAAFVTDVTGGAVRPTRGWITKTRRGARVNVNPRQDAGLADWQRDVVTQIVQPEAWTLYRALGYELPDWIGPSTSEDGVAAGSVRTRWTLTRDADAR